MINKICVNSQESYITQPILFDVSNRNIHTSNSPFPIYQVIKKKNKTKSINSRIEKEKKNSVCSSL